MLKILTSTAFVIFVILFFYKVQIILKLQFKKSTIEELNMEKKLIDKHKKELLMYFLVLIIINFFLFFITYAIKPK